MIKKAMILSAGYGKRLRPLTDKCPKPLLKISDETLLSNTIRFLIHYKIKQVVINVHYLAEQIIDYIKQNKFDLTINIIQEKDKILDTGGGIFNAIQHFSNEPFLVINPDTIWNLDYTKELNLMAENFFSKNQKCALLIVDKAKSFDKNFKGDFNLENNLINRKNRNNLKYVYTGLQIMKPEIFYNVREKFFSINKIWDKLIELNCLYGMVSKINFLHVSTKDVYKSILEKKLYIK